jgi:uncharacterized protein YkwD
VIDYIVSVLYNTLMKRYVIALAIVSTILVIAGISFMSYKAYIALASTPAPAPVVSKYDIGPPDAAEMLELVNMERAKVGVSPLVVDETVKAVAQLKADDMSQRDYYDHPIKGQSDGHFLSPSMKNAVSPLCKGYGENIHIAYTSSEAVSEWLESEGHRRNILRPDYTTTGFGVSPYSDGYYITEHFCLAR